MLALEPLLHDIGAALERKREAERGRVLSGIGHLFVEGGPRYDAQQTELLDRVLQQVARASPVEDRAALAQRLSFLSSAPAGLMGAFAHDVIAVAAPVLAHSTVLTDQVLLSAALAGGGDHMLAICRRPVVSATVSDLLVSKGDNAVRVAIAQNAGARFSGAASAALVDGATAHEDLGRALARRGDLSDLDRDRIRFAGTIQPARLLATLPDATLAAQAAGNRHDSDVPPEALAIRRYGEAMATLHARVGPAGIEESTLAAAAEAGDLRLTIAAMSALTGISLTNIERFMADPATDMPIILARARGWRWATIRAVLRLRNATGGPKNDIRTAELLFNRVSRDTAQGVVQTLKLRDAATRHLPLDDDVRPA